MLKILKFFVIYVFVCQNAPARSENNDLKEAIYTKIFEFESITSYFECETLSVFFNNAQRLKIPVRGIPRQPITEREVSFVTYSRLLVEPLVANTYDPARSVQKLPIDFKLPSVIFVHGLHRTYKEFVPYFKNRLLPKQNINIFLMDWDSYIDYNSMYSRNNTAPRLGTILSKFLHQCIAAGANAKDIYLIGVSSGAQSIGLAGQQVQPKVGKILAIDPVGACYNFGPDSLRVSPGDADFVQIVHCSIGAYGELSEFLGDATFYINGGKVQPQCLDENSLDAVNKCSHNACATYVFETFNNFEKYVGVKCDSYEKYLRKECDCDDRAVMGYDTSTKTRGTYYVDTESKNGPVCGMG